MRRFWLSILLVIGLAIAGGVYFADLHPLSDMAVLVIGILGILFGLLSTFKGFISRHTSSKITVTTKSGVQYSASNIDADSLLELMEGWEKLGKTDGPQKK